MANRPSENVVVQGKIPLRNPLQPKESILARNLCRLNLPLLSILCLMSMLKLGSITGLKMSWPPLTVIPLLQRRQCSQQQTWATMILQLAAVQVFTTSTTRKKGVSNLCVQGEPTSKPRSTLSVPVLTKMAIVRLP